MQFWSKGDNALYTISPTYWENVGVNRQKVHGLHAQFADHFWDSELAQKQNKWSDEDRIMVEDALKEHSDYGHKLRSVDEMDIQSAARVAPLDIATCLFMVTIDGDVETCGRPAISEDGYCQKHAQMQDAPKKKPNAHQKVSA